MQKALVLSIVLHVALFGAARPIAARLALLAEREPEVTAPDVWVGTSIDITTTGAASDSGGAPAPTPAAAAATPAPAPEPETPAATGATTATTAPAATASTGAPTTPAATAKPAAAKPAAAKSATATAGTVPRHPHIRPRKPRPPRPNGSSSAAAAAAPPASAAPSASASASATAGTGDGGPGGSFGSEGQASVRDLGRAFTRAIPAACSADPVWAKLALGDAGSLRVELHVGGDGHLASAEPVDENGPKALVNVLRRTVPLLQAGTFAVRGGAVTAGVETLEIKATVSDDAGGESATGGRDHLAFSYSGGHGKASFTQTGGRRVDVSVRVVSAVAAP
jgi:outer membrane biosynthesis protein TonB